MNIFGIQFSISYEELEEIEWNAAAEGAVMPYAEQMLDYFARDLHLKNIKINYVHKKLFSGKQRIMLKRRRNQPVCSPDL